MPRIMNGVLAIVGTVVLYLVSVCVVSMRGCTISNHGCLVSDNEFAEMANA